MYVTNSTRQIFTSLRDSLQRDSTRVFLFFLLNSRIIRFVIVTQCMFERRVLKSVSILYDNSSI